MSVRPRGPHHSSLWSALLAVGRRAGPALSVELVEDRDEKPFAVLHDILKGQPPAFDVGLFDVHRDSGRIADLLRKEHPAGNKNGT